MSQIPALDELGIRLGGALREELPRVRRRRRITFTASLAAIAVAVPAAGTVTDWAGLAGGETALPTQVDEQLRARLAAGRDSSGPWRLEAYQARLGGTRDQVGVCVFATRISGGSGRCSEPTSLGSLVVASDGSDGQLGMAAGVVRGQVTRVEITVRSYAATGKRQTTNVVAVTPAPPPVSVLQARDLPEDLRPYIVLLSSRPAVAIGTRAIDRRGRTVATNGRPAAARPRANAARSPISSLEDLP